MRMCLYNYLLVKYCLRRLVGPTEDPSVDTCNVSTTSKAILSHFAYDVTCVLYLSFIMLFVHHQVDHLLFSLNWIQQNGKDFHRNKIIRHRFGHVGQITVYHHVSTRTPLCLRNNSHQRCMRAEAHIRLDSK
jgi:hypothetical protein